MSARTVSDLVMHSPRLIEVTDTVEGAVRKVLDSEIAALPVVDEQQRYRGIFGEREFMSALFPGYLDQLQGAAFLSRSIEHALKKRQGCSREPVERYINTEHVEVETDHSDTQLAEIFLHHRVLIIPVLDEGRVEGVVTRRDFFRALAEHFLDSSHE